jgi:hypothetical protein
MALTSLPHAYTAMMSDLIERSFGASFDRDFPETGHFSKKTVKGRDFWYYNRYVKGVGQRQTYVGPDSDPHVMARVSNFEQAKMSYKDRRALVSSMAAAGLTTPDRFAGDVLEAIERAGFFRLRGVLVGTMAFQTYGGLLGVALPVGTTASTEDLDLAQYRSISVAVEDKTDNILESLQVVDPSFRTIAPLNNTDCPCRFCNKGHFVVEFLTPNRGSDDHQHGLVDMPALNGVSAEPLRFLDFLIRNPVRAVVLHKGGIPVTVPSPERYAVHKLLLAERRNTDHTNQHKIRKDVAQAEVLIEALITARRATDLGDAWCEAWERGPTWRVLLTRSLARMTPEIVIALAQAGTQSATLNGDTLADVWPSTVFVGDCDTTNGAEQAAPSAAATPRRRLRAA